MKLPQRRMSRPSLGGMMATRQGAIILSLVCALCATGILLFALGRYKSTVKQPAAVIPQSTVLVATGQIPKGTSGDMIASRGLYKSVPVVTSQLSPGAISDASALAGRQTTTSILAGQQLTSEDLSPQVRIVNTLAPDQRAISLTIPDVAGSLALLQSGDEVDLYSQFSDKSQGGTFNVLLERGAPVLQAPTPAPRSLTNPTAGAPATTATPASTGASAATSTGASASASTTLVLGITTSQVARVIYAAQNGQLYVALRPTKANHTPAVITNLPTVVAGSLSDPTTGARP